MMSNNGRSDEIIKSLPQDVAVKYLNDLQVIQEITNGINENFDVLKNDPKAFENLQKTLSDRLNVLVDQYQDSLIHAGLYYDVKIFSAKSLSAEAKESILKKVENEWGPHYLVKYVVDPSLLGGIRLEVGEAVFDTTFKSRIDQMLREV